MFQHCYDVLRSTSSLRIVSCNITFEQRRRRRQRERQKVTRFRLAETTTLHVLIVNCRHCTTTTWKYLISLFVGDLNTRRRLSFCFPGLRYSLLEFNSRKNCQHLTNWTRWNKRDKGWSSANSRPRSRRRRRCLSSLLKEDPAEECRSSPESFKNPVKKDIYAGS